MISGVIIVKLGVKLGLESRLLMTCTFYVFLWRVSGQKRMRLMICRWVKVIMITSTMVVDQQLAGPIPKPAGILDFPGGVELRPGNYPWIIANTTAPILAARIPRTIVRGWWVPTSTKWIRQRRKSRAPPPSNWQPRSEIHPAEASRIIPMEASRRRVMVLVVVHPGYPPRDPASTRLPMVVLAKRICRVPHKGVRPAMVDPVLLALEGPNKWMKMMLVP